MVILFVYSVMLANWDSHTRIRWTFTLLLHEVIVCPKTRLQDGWRINADKRENASDGSGEIETTTDRQMHVDK